MYAASSNIGGDECVCSVFGELCESSGSLRLTLSAMNGDRGDAISCELFRQAISAMTGAAKHDRWPRRSDRFGEQAYPCVASNRPESVISKRDAVVLRHHLMPHGIILVMLYEMSDITVEGG